MLIDKLKKRRKEDRPTERQTETRIQRRKIKKTHEDAVKETCLLVVLDEIVLVQDRGGGVDQVISTRLQSGVFSHLCSCQTVESWVAKHAHKEVRIPQPVDGFLSILNSPENNLAVQVIRESGYQLQYRRERERERGVASKLRPEGASQI